jgi:hypothetical protein
MTFGPGFRRYLMNWAFLYEFILVFFGILSQLSLLIIIYCEFSPNPICHAALIRIHFVYGILHKPIRNKD